MSFLINISQIILSILLIVAILLQQQGGGLSSVFGGGGVDFYHTRRGMEKWLFRATIVLALLFFLTALLSIIIQ